MLREAFFSALCVHQLKKQVADLHHVARLDMHGGDAAAVGIHLHVGIADHLAAADLAVGRRGALAEAADGVIHIEAAGENFHGILLAGYAGHNARALVVAELEIQGFARVDVAVVRIVVRLIGGSVDIQRVLRLDDRQRAVVARPRRLRRRRRMQTRRRPCRPASHKPGGTSVNRVSCAETLSPVS